MSGERGLRQSRPVGLTGRYPCMDASGAGRYSSAMRFPPSLPVALSALFLAACGGPDPEQAARYALVEDKHII